MKVRIEAEGRTYDITLTDTDEGLEAEVDGHVMHVRVDRRGPGAVVAVEDTDHTVTGVTDEQAVVDGLAMPYRVLDVAGVAGAEGPDAAHQGQVRPPMTGRLESVLVEAGQAVQEGDVLFVLEAMKMRNEVRAPMAGVVAAVHEAPGAAVHTGSIVLVLEPAA